MYYCLKSYFLFDTVTSNITSVYPEVSQMSYTVNETDTVTFECSATGIPPPTITWLRNGMELNATTDSRVTVGDPMDIDFPRANDGETVSMVTRTLNLINTTDGDSGIYTCMATIDADPGSDTETFELIVQGLYMYICRKAYNVRAHLFSVRHVYFKFSQLLQR